MNGWRKVYGVTVDSEQKRPRCMGNQLSEPILQPPEGA